MNVSPWLRYHTTVVPTLAEAIAAVRALRPKSVYLCGGINGLADSACKNWRTVAREALIPADAPWTGCRVLDPMSRDYRGKEDESVREIVEGDKRDVLDSDVILVNACRPSWGTAMEIMFAWSLQKPVVSFMEAP